MRHLFDSPLGVFVPLGVPKNIGIGAAALAAGIAATASTASSIYNNYQANLANDEAYKRTKELQELQFKQQKDLYNHQFQKESEYNSPSHLRELYEKAGYNANLLAHNGDIGNAATSPSMPNVPVASPFGPRQVFPMDLQNGVGGISSALALGSEIKKNDAESFQKIVSSLPELGKSLGWENARQYAKDMLGMFGVSGSQYERLMNAQIDAAESESRSKAVKASLDEAFGVRDANQKFALGEQALSESFARVGKMGSDRALNDAEIKKLATDCVRNVADAWKLHKEGDKYVADAKTVNALRSFLVSQSRSQALIMGLNAFMSGADPVSPIHDFKYSKGHVKAVIDALSITDEQQSSQLIRALDKVLGEYFKVSNGSSPQYNFNSYYNP